MRNYIDSCHNESEARTLYQEQSTVHFENLANITVNSDIIIPQEKKNWSEKDHQAIPYGEN